MSRISSYLGLGSRINDPALASRYSRDLWTWEKKYDGIWSAIETDGQGIIARISTRTGKRVDVHGISGYKVGIRDSIFIAELETTTDAAIRCAAKRGWTNTYWFDVVKLMGKDTIDLPQHARSDLVTKCTDICKEIRFIQRAEVCPEDMSVEEFYNAALDDDNDPVEGLVGKNKESNYRSSRSDGKTDNWIGLKPLNSADLVVVDKGRTPSGADNLVVGVWKLGKVEVVQNISTPRGYEASNLIGKVIECVYDRKHDSGSYRHLRFLRVRTDKNVEMATG